MLSKDIIPGGFFVGGVTIVSVITSPTGTCRRIRTTGSGRITAFVDVMRMFWRWCSVTIRQALLDSITFGALVVAAVLINVRPAARPRLQWLETKTISSSPHSALIQKRHHGPIIAAGSTLNEFSSCAVDSCFDWLQFSSTRPTNRFC